ncbi:MAG: penicillin-binding protein 2 [Candidatus Nealsonbacteria bacterium]|nr:penicillin-binding protein 2 [Candidatus Nealsonbacteria bacterium]
MKGSRMNLVLAALILLGATVIGRLFFLQVLQGGYYRALAQGQQKFFSPVSGERGEIFFSGGQILATNYQRQFVYVSPREVKEKEKAEKALSQILDIPPEMVREKLNQDSLYQLVKNKVTDEEAERLQRLEITGVYIGQERVRTFPQQTLGSQTVGFVDSEKQGQYGLEGFYQDVLSGQEGMIEGERGVGGLLISFSPSQTEKGRNLVLTLDYPIQFEAERLLAEAQKGLQFESGTIIVLRPDSGEILALANYPGFDPNNYEQEKDLKIFQNPASQKIFEPGSVFKAITLAATIEEGKVTPQTTYVDAGVVRIGRTPIYNYDRRTWGQRTMTEVLEKSINTGAVFAEQQLGSNLFLKYLEKFGFFEKTNIDLQGEVFSQNQEFKKGYEINFATAAFGQGIEITPLQLVRAFSALANGGKLVKPHLVKEIIDQNGQSQKISPEITDNIISPRTSSQIVSMLTSVVENGYGKKAKVPGYFVAGKTGTAQVSWGALGIDKPGYSDQTIQSFIGFAPAFNPKFLILVKLDNPQTKTAEYSAIPIFHDLAKYIIDAWQIPPDYQ